MSFPCVKSRRRHSWCWHVDREYKQTTLVSNVCPFSMVTYDRHLKQKPAQRKTILHYLHVRNQKLGVVKWGRIQEERKAWTKFRCCLSPTMPLLKFFSLQGDNVFSASAALVALFFLSKRKWNELLKRKIMASYKTEDNPKESGRDESNIT
jgi:hypothetical protein